MMQPSHTICTVTEKQMKPCHTAAEAWWEEASTCCQNRRLPVCWCMFCAVHSFSISAQFRLKILDISDGVMQIRKHNGARVSPLGWGNPWTSVCEASWEMGLWRRKHARLFWSAPCLRQWRAMSCAEQSRPVGPMAVKAITGNKETL